MTTILATEAAAAGGNRRTLPTFANICAPVALIDYKAGPLSLSTSTPTSIIGNNKPEQKKPFN